MLSGAGYWAYKMWKSAEEAAIESCLHSIAEAANKAIKAGRLEAADNARELTPAEIEQLLNGYEDLDCRGKNNLSQEVYVGVGNKINEHTDFKMKVWTVGDDGVAGTDDDLVVPLGEKVK
ncbi:MAG: hypothetical protein M3384_01105 [Acidobacteriota bacterium]|nr:hypothetical protein [Acidobacteriota bacterium]